MYCLVHLRQCRPFCHSGITGIREFCTSCLVCLFLRWFCCLLSSLQFSDCILQPDRPCFLNHCVLLTCDHRYQSSLHFLPFLVRRWFCCLWFSLYFSDRILLPTLTYHLNRCGFFTCLSFQQNLLLLSSGDHRYQTSLHFHYLFWYIGDFVVC